MHNKFDRSAAVFSNVIPKLQISKENSIFTKGFNSLAGFAQTRIRDGGVDNKIKSQTSYSGYPCAKY